MGVQRNSIVIILMKIMIGTIQISFESWKTHSKLLSGWTNIVNSFENTLSILSNRVLNILQKQIHVDATGDGSWKQKLLGWGNAVADLNNTRAQCWTVEEDIETFKSAGFKVAREYQVDDYAGNSTRHFRGALMNYVPVNLLRLVFNQPGALARVVGTSGGQQPSVLLANADNPLPPLTTRLRYATIADRRRLFVTETMAFRRNTDFNSVQSNMLENLQNLLEPENIYLVAEIEAEDITPRDGLKPPVVNGKMIVGYLKLKLGEKTERVEQITN